ncbi:MAG: hypothetical protein QM768_20645 [Agriterribacter sp.]
MNIRSLPEYLENLHFRNSDTEEFNLRKYYPISGKSHKLHIQNYKFSIFTQNMALVVFPVSYKGYYPREVAFAEIIIQIRLLNTDIVGLCEVFDNDERLAIFSSLKDVYPYYLEGPDERDLDQDGGLLLLSKYPFIQTEEIVFTATRGGDAWANKGALYARIWPPGISQPIDLIYSHTQDLEATFSNPSNILDFIPANREILLSQFEQILNLLKDKNSVPVPYFIFGDLNMPGDNINDLDDMLKHLGYPADLWLVGNNLPEDGLTNIRNNNFYDDGDDKPQKDHRLDFILMKAYPSFIPVLKEIHVMKFMKNGRNISDHFGLLARFDEFLNVDTF